MKALNVRIDPHWQVQGPGGLPVPPRALQWLAAIQVHGSLAAACKAEGASYRHGWKLLREAEAALGAPLLTMVRGKGSVLTELGEALVWSQRRFEARLRPQLDSLAFELQTELHRVLLRSGRALRVCASHGFAIEVLQGLLAAQGTEVDWRYTDSQQALAALHSGNADLVSLHLPVASSPTQQALQSDLLRQHRPWLGPDWLYVHMVSRRQGLMLPPGNPHHIDQVADLLRPGLRLAGRAPGSGTRLLLEGLLRAQGLDPRQLNDAGAGEHTHAAVAAFVASGMADAGFGVEASARRFGLEFIPVQTELYGLLLPPPLLDTAPVQQVLQLLASPACHAALAQLPGYRAAQCGQVMRAAEVFEAWP